ncbi:glycosyltransferase involved in cell wall biosynthesis [Arthrobacter pascens]|uniref:glycosyltransferase family 2 protein n=1 Tax=Arthrobacter pascens TaxID=1677 RepID=UPI002782AE61|nr:glycosyltransferase family A protein [Arthrobacter pascens]MDQ0633323.1 glycosyltransferase involved in cell wall biosynthesis [Arthrobacter pascens]
MSPKVSIVIPAYNNVQYIEETLESVLNQSFDDYEVVIADHSSIDGTAEVIARFADHPKVRVLSPTPTGGGAQANWNRVSQAATGEYLKLVCGDDLIARDALAHQVEALESNPGAVIVSSLRDLVDADGRLFLKGRGLQGVSGRVSGRQAIRATVRAGSNIFGEPACSLFRRDILAKEGWWDNTHPYLIDEATLARICRHGDFVALRESLASFRISASQWSVRLARQQSDQAISFHHRLREDDPTLLSRFDVILGNARAIAVAYARRLAYIRLNHRMGHQHAVESTV